MEDKIEAYYAGDLTKEDLSDQENMVRKRVIDLWSLMRDEFFSPSKAVEEHCTRLSETEEAISLRTAWRDYDLVKRIFGDRGTLTKEAMFRMAYEHALIILRDCKDDMQERNRAFKNLVEVIKNMPGDIRRETTPGTYILQFNVNGKPKPIEINLTEMPGMEDAQVVDIINSIDQHDISDEQMQKLLGNEGDS